MFISAVSGAKGASPRCTRSAFIFSATRCSTSEAKVLGVGVGVGVGAGVGAGVGEGDGEGAGDGEGEGAGAFEGGGVGKKRERSERRYSASVFAAVRADAMEILIPNRTKKAASGTRRAIVDLLTGISLVSHLLTDRYHPHFTRGVAQ